MTERVLIHRLRNVRTGPSSPPQYQIHVRWSAEECVRALRGIRQNAQEREEIAEKRHRTLSPDMKGPHKAGQSIEAIQENWLRE